MARSKRHAVFLVCFKCLFLFLASIALVSSSATTEQDNIPSPTLGIDQAANLNSNEDDAKAFLANYDDEYSKLVTQVTRASWNYDTNLTDYNAKLLEQISAELDAYSSAAYANASQFDSSSFSAGTRRLLNAVGSPGLSPEEMKQLSQIENEMARVYSSHQVCHRGRNNNNDVCLSLDPDITNIMSQSRNATERLSIWQHWHEGVGRALRPHYVKYVHFKNRLAKLKQFKDFGEEWRQKYEIDDLDAVVRDLYQEIEPLYRQLHAYVRRKLFQVYGPRVIDLKGPLPAHLLGDVWGRFWSGVYDIVQPYPKKPSLDPSRTMLEQNYTVQRMFEMGNEFFVSMGMKPVPDAFYNLSMLEKPGDGRKVVCHPTAWDFGDGIDFRIKMCAQVSFDDFLTVHHELGHTQYQMQYAHLPLGYRDGANDGFHEAIGELMSMSVATKKHLHSIGLLHHIDQDSETDINFLMGQALRTVTALPFHLVQDTWRWKIFAGLPVDKWNSEFWKQKLETVGVAPSVPRNSEKDLDGAAIYHVATGFDMIRYFTRTVMQYQFAEALCNASGHAGPLHECDFYNSTAAGNLLARMLSMGSSRPWPEAMEVLTGQRKMSAQPLLNYFKPLSDWLEEENIRNKEQLGWQKESATNSASLTQCPQLFLLTATLVLSRLAL